MLQHELSARSHSIASSQSEPTERLPLSEAIPHTQSKEANHAIRAWRLSLRLLMEIFLIVLFFAMAQLVDTQLCKLTEEHKRRLTIAVASTIAVFVLCLFALCRRNHVLIFVASLSVAIYFAFWPNFCERGTGLTLLAVILLATLWQLYIVSQWMNPKETAHPETYDTIFHKLDTGDVLLVSEGGWISWVIVFFTKCKFSHTALIVKDPPAHILDMYYIKEEAEDGLYVLEVDPGHLDVDEDLMDAKGDTRNATRKGAVRMHPMGDYVYSGLATCAVRQIVMQRHPENIQQFMDWIGSPAVAFATYDWRNFVCGFMRFNVTSDDREFFCAELVIRGLQELGAVDMNLNPENVGPHGLDHEGIVEYCLEEEVQFLPLTMLNIE